MSVSVHSAMKIFLLDPLVLCLRLSLGSQLRKYELDRRVHVITLHILVYKTRVDLIDGDDKGLIVVLCKLKLGDSKAIQIMLVLYIVVLDGIVVVADGSSEEKFHVVTEADPEAAIVFSLVVNLTGSVGGPLR